MFGVRNIYVSIFIFAMFIAALRWGDILVAYALFNMQNYLTDVWKLSIAHAAGILNVCKGISRILPLFFLFLAHQFLGHFKMLLISSAAFSVGIVFIAMSTPPILADSTNTCKQYEPQCIGHTEKALFYTGMALMAVGMAGHLASLKPFLEEQLDRPDDPNEETKTDDPKEETKTDDPNRKTKNCLKIGFFFVVYTPVLGAMALAYIKPWSLRFGIPAICTVMSTLLFLSGSGEYDKFHRKDEGSPITNVCRVFVAFAFKISQPFPLDANQLYRRDNDRVKSFTRTRFLRRLEKASIICEEDQVENRWRLCSVEEVEEAKIALRMIPMWLTFIVCGIVSSIGNTYFVEQANNMNRKIGAWKVPLQVIMLFSVLARSLFSWMAHVFLDRSKKHRPPKGIAIAMMLSILCCITAAIIEKRRINVIRSHGLLDKPDDDIPMSVCWLLLQFFLLAGLDSFFQKSVVAFYEDQAPESMRDYLSYFTNGVSGLGFMFSVISVYVVGKVSGGGGRRSWFQHTLNRSRLDRYYWFLAALSSANLIVFILVALCYRYKNCEARQSVEEIEEIDEL